MGELLTNFTSNSVELATSEETSEATDFSQTVATEHITPGNPNQAGQKIVSSRSVQRAMHNPRSLGQADVLKLQRCIGNQAVTRLLAATRTPPPEPGARVEIATNPPTVQQPAQIQRLFGFGLGKVIAKAASVVKRPKLASRRHSVPPKLASSPKRRHSAPPSKSDKPAKFKSDSLTKAKRRHSNPPKVQSQHAHSAQHTLPANRRHSAPPVVKLDKLNVQTKLHKIQTASPAQRQKWLNDPAYMHKLHWRFHKPQHRHALHAALMEGHTHRWGKSSFYPASGNYKSDFYKAMQNKKTSRFDNTPMEMMCMESVLYSAHLAKILPSKKLVEFMKRSTPARNSTTLLRDQPTYWENLGYKKDLLTHRLNSGEIAPEFHDVGRMLFFRQNPNQPPWHVGLSVGNGKFVGMPGRRGDKMQETLHIDDYLRENSGQWAEAGDFFHNLPLVKKLLEE